VVTLYSSASAIQFTVLLLRLPARSCIDLTSVSLAEPCSRQAARIQLGVPEKLARLCYDENGECSGVRGRKRSRTSLDTTGMMLTVMIIGIYCAAQSMIATMSNTRADPRLLGCSSTVP